jgi:Protein of unknown function (DUF3987)/RepB DNA-primase from phage plasmid
MSALAPDLKQAAQFLALLDPDAEKFTFQVFDDSPLKRGHLAKIDHGSLDDVSARLEALQGGGAGAFVTVNETDGQGRREENVKRVRAVFADLDGSPIAPVLTCQLEPHVIVESSPDRYHAYWMVDGLPLDQFGPVQKAIAARFNGDSSVKDPSRVMRLPGFIHQKAEPFRSRIAQVNERLPYDVSEILAEFEPSPAQPAANGYAHDVEPMSGLTRQIMTGEHYHEPLCALAWRYVSSGMAGGQVVKTLRGLMQSSQGPRDERWQARYEEIPRTVSTAQDKQEAGRPAVDFAFLRGEAAVTAGAPGEEAPGEGAAWAEPVDIIGAPELVGWPELTSDCLPAPLYNYVTNEAERLNVDPCALSAHVLAAVSAVCSDAWKVKPKRHDRWTQQPRLWVCVVKDVGQRGTEMIRSAFWPVAKIENELRAKWQKEMAEWAERQAQRKKGDKTPDPRPALPRLTTQDATIEAASQILAQGNEYSKLTYKSDELVTFLGSAGRYTPKGDAARALWLEGYDGGPQHIDRIIRGNVYVPNWSIGVAGNIQPRRLAGMAKDLIDDGLFQRFITIHTKPSTPCPDDDQPVDSGAGRDYAALLRAIRNLMPAKKVRAINAWTSTQMSRANMRPFISMTMPAPCAEPSCPCSTG